MNCEQLQDEYYNYVANLRLLCKQFVALKLMDKPYFTIELQWNNTPIIYSLLNMNPCIIKGDTIHYFNDMDIEDVLEYATILEQHLSSLDKKDD